MSIADQLRRHAQSIPLSDPGEQGALASARGLLGEQQRHAQANLYGAAQRNVGGGFQNAGDLMSNLSLQQTGQQMSLDSAHLLAALSDRRNSLLQASQAAGGALQAAAQPRPDPNAGLPELFGALAQTSAYRKAQRQYDEQRAPVWNDRLGQQIHAQPAGPGNVAYGPPDPATMPAGSLTPQKPFWPQVFGSQTGRGG